MCCHELYAGHGEVARSPNLKRREFVKGTLAAGVALALPGVTFLRSSAEAECASPDAPEFRAQRIWVANSMPVPLKPDGPAIGIASSEGKRSADSIPDLHAVFAKEFTVDALPVKASMRLFCYTRYRLYVNGVYQGRGPSRFQNQRPEYDMRDISHALRLGKNWVAVLVHRDNPTGRIMEHEPGFAASLHLRAGSGEATVSTDASWWSRPELSFGPRDKAWSSVQENIDARKALDLRQPEFSPAGWTPSTLVSGTDPYPVWPRTTPLQSEIERPWSSKEIRLPLPMRVGAAVTFELPEIAQAYHRIELDADEGSELEVKYLLPGDESSGANTYIARAGVQTYMGGDTFAQKALSIQLRSGRVKLLQVSAVEVRYPFERVASFESSDPFLNRLWSICARSLEVLSEDSYVDCADRERVEWTDDSPPAFDCTRVMMRGPDSGDVKYWGDNRLLKALLRRIGLTQLPDGQIKAHSCSERFDIHAVMEDRSCDWVILLREYLESSEDTSLVCELWPTLKRLMEWFLTRRTDRGLVLAREWEVWDNPLRYQVCEGAGLNAFTYRALRDAEYLGERIGATRDSERFGAAAKQLKSDYNRLLWNDAEGTYDGALFGPGSKKNKLLGGEMFTGPIVNGRYHPTAQAALFALYCDIVPTERLSRVRTWLGSHLDQVTGPMSHYYLFHALYAADSEHLDQEVLRRMRDQWKGQVESPWQTTWESLKDDGGSKVHMYGMVPGSFLTTHVLGVRRVGSVADRSIRIEPRCGDLERAEGIAVTEFGPVPIRWSKANSGLSLECTVPAHVTATLRLYLSGQNGLVTIDGRPHRGKLHGDVAGGHTRGRSA